MFRTGTGLSGAFCQVPIAPVDVMPGSYTLTINLTGSALRAHRAYGGACVRRAAAVVWAMRRNETHKG